MGITDRVRILCERKGITINKLEKDTGIGRGNVARWNKHQPGPDKLAAVASFFEVPVDLLLGYGPQAYILDLDIQIAETQKKIKLSTDEKVLENLYAELEILEENRSDTEYALAIANLEGAKNSPSEDREMVALLEELKDRSDLRALLDAARVRSPKQVSAMTEFLKQMKGED